MTEQKKRMLLFGGNPRSGTTALTSLLNCHEKIFVSSERFFQFFKQRTLEPHHFSHEILTDPFAGAPRFESMMRAKGMTEPEVAKARKGLAQSYDRADFIGDKYPPIYETYDWLWDRFPNATVLYIVRNPVSVAESYRKRLEAADDPWKLDMEDALTSWNSSVVNTLDALSEGRNIVVVSYERLFSSVTNCLRLFKALGLDPNRADQTHLETLTAKFRDINGKEAPRDDLFRLSLFMNARIEEYRRLIKDYCVIEADQKIRKPAGELS